MIMLLSISIAVGQFAVFPKAPLPRYRIINT